MQTTSRWLLSNGVELPEPDVPLFVPQEVIDGRQPFGGFRSKRLDQATARKALDTYQWAHDNAVELIEDAGLLARNGRHARALALACTALEEIGKSQYAADVHTAFIPAGGFEGNIRKHNLKTGYAARVVQSGEFLEPLLRDEETAKKIFRRRNDALYAWTDNKVKNDEFERDALTMIAYCMAWLERIRSQEEIAERIGTKAFLK